MASKGPEIQDLFSQMAVRGAIEEVWRLIGENVADQMALRKSLADVEGEIAKTKITSKALKALIAERAARWHERTGACPFCGELGILHVT
jgi:hypothetical protein